MPGPVAEAKVQKIREMQITTLSRRDVHLLCHLGQQMRIHSIYHPSPDMVRYGTHWQDVTINKVIFEHLKILLCIHLHFSHPELTDYIVYKSLISLNFLETENGEKGSYFTICTS
jgi:hypothetical protein